MITIGSLSAEDLKRIIEKLPSGYARQKYERVLSEKISTPLGVISCEEISASYYLDEIVVLRHLNEEQLKEIHRAKLTYPSQRIIQEGPEKHPDRAHQSNQ